MRATSRTGRGRLRLPPRPRGPAYYRHDPGPLPGCGAQPDRRRTVPARAPTCATGGGRARDPSPRPAGCPCTRGRRLTVQRPTHQLPPGRSRPAGRSARVLSDHSRRRLQDANSVDGATTRDERPVAERLGAGVRRMARRSDGARPEGKRPTPVRRGPVWDKGRAGAVRSITPGPGDVGVGKGKEPGRDPKAPGDRPAESAPQTRTGIPHVARTASGQDSGDRPRSP